MKRVDNEAHYARLNRILTPLGFTHIGSGRFYHRIIPETRFDFSACSINGISYHIYKMGEQNGEEKAKKAIRKSLGID